MDSRKIFISTLSVLTAGIAIGLLVAPAKGSETRQMISDSKETLKKKLRKIKNSAGSELDELRETFENEVDGLKDDVREKILNLIEASKKSYGRVKDKAMSN